MAIDTGLGATASFATLGLSLKIVSMDIGEQTLPNVNVSTLASTNFEEYIPGDLAEPGTVTFECQFDNAQSQIDTGTVDTLTVTLPLSSGGTTAATWVGTGFINSVKSQNFVKNELQMQTIVWQFDGGANSGTEPTFTAQV